MSLFGRAYGLFLVAALFVAASPALGQDVPVNMEHYTPACGVAVRHNKQRVLVGWHLGTRASGRLTLDLRRGKPLIESLRIARESTETVEPLLEGVEPLTFLTVGTRQAPPNRPPEMSIFNTFFDKPASRPHQTHVSRLDLRQVQVTSTGRRASVAVGDLTIGPFSGELVFTFYAGSPLVHVEAVVATSEDRRAILYDTALAGASPSWRRMAWVDTEGTMQRADIDVDKPEQWLAVRHRTLIAEEAHGSVACFPPPHQYQFPRDWSDNLKFTWMGRNHAGFTHPFGFGVRQVADGGRPFEPWFNAPPSTRQRLGVFYLLSGGKAEDALKQTLRYTHGDRFPALPGHITFTSHWHMAVATSAMTRKTQETPDFVRMFKDMGINAVHLADFHGDGHQKDPGPLRLPEQEMLFRECERLSDGDLLMIPGEEVDDFLGIKERGKHPGHWMSLFPRPVYWVMQRRPEQAFVEQSPRYGRSYRVGSRADMVKLLQEEHGLAWTAHPRIKASSWTPDIFCNEDFYRADSWLGAAWKAMPSDLSRDRLGERGLNLLDDMANWGPHKYMPGEVDVFKIDHTHELYGHMNINYLRLARLPRFEEGWQPILDALRAGQFFVTTG
ncbi:MAG TPA: hypothetical protein VKI17_12205, partial [Gemmataceae bacterium]|nr:hypothetical protein [Gemmataceae bacterium]